MLSAKQGGIFWIFGMVRPRIEPWSPGQLANTLFIRPMVLEIQTDPLILVIDTSKKKKKEKREPTVYWTLPS